MKLNYTLQFQTTSEAVHKRSSPQAKQSTSEAVHKRSSPQAKQSTTQTMSYSYKVPFDKKNKKKVIGNKGRCIKKIQKELGVVIKTINESNGTLPYFLIEGDEQQVYIASLRVFSILSQTQQSSEKNLIELVTSMANMINDQERMINDLSQVIEEHNSSHTQTIPVEDDSINPVEDDSINPVEDDSINPVEDDSINSVEDDSINPVEDDSINPQSWLEWEIDCWDRFMLDVGDALNE